MKRHIIVDGYNVIKRDHELLALERKSLEAARGRLLALLGQSRRLKNDQITVVFDGSATNLSFPVSSTQGRIRIIYSGNLESADSVIQRLLRSMSTAANTVVLSDDREIRDAALGYGSTVGGATSRQTGLPYSGHHEDSQRAPDKKGPAKRPKRKPPEFRW